MTYKVWLVSSLSTNNNMDIGYLITINMHIIITYTPFVMTDESDE